MDVWSWSSPIALGLFLLMASGMVVLLAAAIKLLSKAVETFANLPQAQQAYPPQALKTL